MRAAATSSIVRRPSRRSRTGALRRARAPQRNLNFYISSAASCGRTPHRSSSAPTTRLPCNTMKIYKIYDETVQLKIDALNHLYPEGNSLIAGLERYGVEVDGKEQGIEILRDYLPLVQQTI